MDEVERLKLRLEVLIEIHEYLRQPFMDKIDMLGYLTQQKKLVRRRIDRAKKQHPTTGG